MVTQSNFPLQAITTIFYNGKFYIELSSTNRQFYLKTTSMYLYIEPWVNGFVRLKIFSNFRELSFTVSSRLSSKTFVPGLLLALWLKLIQKRCIFSAGYFTKVSRKLICKPTIHRSSFQTEKSHNYSNKVSFQERHWNTREQRNIETKTLVNKIKLFFTFPTTFEV